jgi:hypothetical protein
MILETRCPLDHDRKQKKYHMPREDLGGHGDRMVVGFTTTYAICLSPLKL